MTAIEIILVLLAVVVFLPWTAYTVAKLATAGYLRAKHNFRKETEDGKEKETKTVGKKVG